MQVISLPATAYEHELVDLLDLLASGDSANQIQLDFQSVRFWTPGALVMVLGKIQHWFQQKKEVHFENYQTCAAFRYLQRINFFSQCDFKLPEDFRRHDTGGKFVELRAIGGPGAASVEELSTDIAYCLFPEADVDDPDESGLFDLLQYSVSELVNNVSQHAQGMGFITAQYTGRTDLIRLGIADKGIGVLNSYEVSGSPHWKSDLTDADAIALSLQAKVSSKSHNACAWGESVNAGVGLTLLKQLCEITGGDFFMASGYGVCRQTTRDKTLLRSSLQGVIEALCARLHFDAGKSKTFPSC